jgi:hypothetical protein
MVQATQALAAPRAPAPAGGDGLTFCRIAMDEAECIAFEGLTPTSILPRNSIWMDHAALLISTM